MYTSKISVTVDIVLIKDTNPKQLLLIKRKNEPFKDCWALPGGFVDENEDLEIAAKRELEEETQVKINELIQIGAYGKPFRDPRSHVVSIAYFSTVNKNTIAKASDDAKEAKWFKINDLPDLAFDHIDIINDTINKHNLL
ncbi:MAG TPA: NUDIX hydrolase [Flavobacterium sp.]|nr:NUDIX hydrolase [Flavobacterium sp.]